jgi:hypothetical protein
VAARKRSNGDFQLLTEELLAQVNALVDIGDQTSGLLASARRLAEHHPLLGTAPPATHLSSRLRDAAGPAGLTGEVSAADTELANYHQALRDTVNRYRDGDTDVTWRLTNDGPRQ